MVVLRDTASLFRRKAEEYRAIIVGIGDDCPPGWQIRFAIYQHEADRLDDLISLCDGTATKNASADTLPVAGPDAGIDVLPSYVTVTVAETMDDDSPTLPLMPRSGLTPQR
jgi:hypothetical protein